jgi:hypothetical protein
MTVPVGFERTSNSNGEDRSRSLRDDNQKATATATATARATATATATATAKTKYRDLSTAAAKCAAFGRDDVGRGGRQENRQQQKQIPVG